MNSSNDKYYWGMCSIPLQCRNVNNAPQNMGLDSICLCLLLISIFVLCMIDCWLFCSLHAKKNQKTKQQKKETSLPFLSLTGFVLLNLNDIFLFVVGHIPWMLIWKVCICWSSMVGNAACLVQLVLIKLKKRSFWFKQAYFLMMFIMLSSSLTNRALVWLDRGS